MCVEHPQQYIRAWPLRLERMRELLKMTRCYQAILLILRIRYLKLRTPGDFVGLFQNKASHPLWMEPLRPQILWNRLSLVQDTLLRAT